MNISATFAAVLSACSVFTCVAADWSQWRGPEFNGSSPEKNLPSHWSKEKAVWAADMPGASAAVPIVLGERVFVSSIDDSAKTLHALCLDRKSGRILWNNKTGDGARRDELSNFASPSPIADANRVFFFYGNGTLVCFDHAGKEIWNRSITGDYGDFAFQWTFASTPLLFNGKLYLEILQRDTPVNGKGKKGAESFLLALDPASGKTLWKVVRPSEANAESKEAYSTPVPFTHNGRTELFITGGDVITGHDPESGKELWRWGTWNPSRIGHWRLVPSPVAGGGVVLACAPKGSPIYAVKLGGMGALDDSWIAWNSSESREVSADVATPAFADGDFFVLGDVRKQLVRIDPKGKVKWMVELPGRKKWECSPTVADGKIYAMNFGGEVIVADAAKGEILNTIQMGEPGDDKTRSAISVAYGHLFIRTNKKLYCIGQDSSVASAR